MAGPEEQQLLVAPDQIPMNNDDAVNAKSSKGHCRIGGRLERRAMDNSTYLAVDGGGCCCHGPAARRNPRRPRSLDERTIAEPPRRVPESRH